MSETILTAENLKFRYDNEQPVYALDGVSTSVKRGEFVAVQRINRLFVVIAELMRWTAYRQA